uniref:Uncharacterized protein n=1 Tax=Salix viminalis TaxID=40686 RepID=A0A6N2MFH0_SALVM
MESTTSGRPMRLLLSSDDDDLLESSRQELLFKANQPRHTPISHFHSHPSPPYAKTCLDSSSTSLIFLPINLFTEKKVFSEFTTACLFAICPTSRSPFAVYAPTDGVVLCPSTFVTIVGFPPSIAATAELVVPGSIPKMAPETAGP